jgi:hypothetical protein
LVLGLIDHPIQNFEVVALVKLLKKNNSYVRFHIDAFVNDAEYNLMYSENTPDEIVCALGISLLLL